MRVLGGGVVGRECLRLQLQLLGFWSALATAPAENSAQAIVAFNFN